MTRLHALLTPFLTLALVLTTVGLGTARGAMAAQGEICSVTSVVAVVMAHDGLPLIDRSGQPVVVEGEVCLDCQLMAFALSPHRTIERALPLPIGPDHTRTAASGHRTLHPVAGLARAPPLNV